MAIEVASGMDGVNIAIVASGTDAESRRVAGEMIAAQTKEIKERLATERTNPLTVDEEEQNIDYECYHADTDLRDGGVIAELTVEPSVANGYGVAHNLFDFFYEFNEAREKNGMPKKGPIR